MSFERKGGVMAKAVGRLGELSQDELLDDYYVALRRAKMDRVDREAYVREEGEKKGIKEGQSGVILALLESMGPEKVAELTKLPLDRVLEIQKEDRESKKS